MSFLQKIKSLFVGDTNSDHNESDTTVTVEREPGESTDTDHASADGAQEEPEADPDGIDNETEIDESGIDESGIDESGIDEPEAGGAVAADQTVGGEGDDDDHSDVEESNLVTEADEADVDGTQADDTDVDETEADEEDAEESKIVTETGDDDTAGEPIERIKGIGPAYGNRLGEIGIETITQLAAADPVEVAEQTGVGESRASTWIDRAKEF